MDCTKSGQVELFEYSNLATRLQIDISLCSNQSLNSTLLGSILFTALSCFCLAYCITIIIKLKMFM